MQLNGSHEEWQLSPTTGWHFGAYIMPDGSVIGESEKPILFTGKRLPLMVIPWREQRWAGVIPWRDWLVVIRP